MALRGGCQCGNLQVVWKTVDYSVAPRACQCEYCRRHGAAYVSKAGTAFSAHIARPAQYRVVHHGSGMAQFHECSHCGELVFVTAQLNGDCYGALNAACLGNPLGFAEPVCVQLAAQTPEQKTQRWLETWCRPVRIRSG
jgi:hypothetical protein